MASPKLVIETLEGRIVPTVFGTPWGSPQTLTISFAPDGTPIEGATSNQSTPMMMAGLSTTAWKGEILRAFQAWADVANINIAVTTDDGSPYGTAGATQGDSRFGDIRVFARPLSDSVFAVTAPPNEIAGSRAGDIVLNSNKQFQIGSAGTGTDLFTLALQEAGHAFGMGDNLDKTSAMYDYYTGPRTGLNASDVAAIQGVYGKRVDSVGDAGDTSATAMDLTSTTGIAVTPGELRTATDVDFYSFPKPSGGMPMLRVVLEPRSLLTGRVTLYDASGTLIGQGTATGSGASVTVDAMVPSGTGNITAKVEAAPGTLFATGAYRFRVQTQMMGMEQVVLQSVAIATDAGTDDTFATATPLSVIDTTASAPRYNTVASIGSTTDIDVYAIATPTLPNGQLGDLTVTIRSVAGGSVPTIQVFDSTQTLVAADIVAIAGGLTSVRVRGATPNATYFVKVGGAAAVTGAYQLAIAFPPSSGYVSRLQTGVVTATSPTQPAIFVVAYSSATHLSVTAWDGAVTAKVRNQANTVVLTLSAADGATASGFLLLQPGVYTIAFTGPIGAKYLLAGATLSDPMGIIPNDPTFTPIGSPPTYNPPPTDPPPPFDPPAPNIYEDLIWWLYEQAIGVIIKPTPNSLEPPAWLTVPRLIAPQEVAPPLGSGSVLGF